MAELEADCLKIGRAPWRERRYRAKFAGGGANAMQAMRKKLSQEVSKKLDGVHFEVELQ